MIMDWWIHVSGRGHGTMLWFPDILSVRPPVTRRVAGARLQEEGCAKLLGAGSVAWHNWAPNSEVVAYYKNYTSLWRNHRTNPCKGMHDERWSWVKYIHWSLGWSPIPVGFCWSMSDCYCCWLIFWCWMIGWHTAFSAIFCFFVNASLADEQPHFLLNSITFLGGCTLLKGEPGVSPAEGDPGEINRQVCKPVKGKKDWQGWWKLMSGRIRAFVEVSANIWVVLGE